jgi:Tfp pilus assembly protein PilO
VILSKRERYILICTLCVIGGLIFYLYVASPYWDTRNSWLKEKGRLADKISSANAILDQSKQLTPEWQEMQKGGLKSSPSEAESAVLRAVREWLTSAGMGLASVKPERLPVKGELQEIAYQVSATGSMAQVSQFLWLAYSTSLPVRVEEAQLAARKPGTDDLSLTVRLNGIYAAPAGEAGSETVRRAPKAVTKGASK